MVTKNMTKADLFGIIEGKLSGLKPHQRASVMQDIKYQTKASLKRKATHMKVEIDKDGYDVYWRGY